MGKTFNIIFIFIIKDLTTFHCLPNATRNHSLNKNALDENEVNDYGRIISLFSITVLALTWIVISAISWGFYFALRNPTHSVTTSIFRDPNLQAETIQLAQPISINYKQLEKDSENPQLRKENATMLTANEAYGSDNFQNKNLQIRKEDGHITRINNGSPNYQSISGNETQTTSSGNQCWCCRKPKFDSYDSRYTGTSTITPDNVELLKASQPPKYVENFRDRQFLSSTEVVPQVQNMEPVQIEKNPILRPVSVTITEEPKCKTVLIDTRKSSLVNKDKADVIYYPPPYEIRSSPPPQSSFVTLPPLSPLPPPPPPPPPPPSLPAQPPTSFPYHSVEMEIVNQPQKQPPPILIPASTKPTARDTAFGSTRNSTGCYVCSSTPRRRTEGEIHPIIEGYKVQGHLRVKGKNNSDTISFMEDDYDVLR